MPEVNVIQKFEEIKRSELKNPFAVLMREPIPKGLKVPLVVEGLKLFAEKIDALKLRQAGLVNCPLVAVAAAIAHVCPAQIKQIITEKEVDVQSWFKDEVGTKRIDNKRLIIVHFTKIALAISPLLYFDYFKQPRFARSTDGAGWISYIEKAYAMRRGDSDYANLNAGLGVGLVMSDLVGTHHKMQINPSTPDGESSELRKLLRRASRLATVATTHSEATRLTRDHALMVQSFNAGGVLLFDAMRDLKPLLTLQAFKENCDGLYQAAIHPECP
jgi:hypothetical protein